MCGFWQFHKIFVHKKWLWKINEGENDAEKINTTVYRKDTHNYLFLHWNSFKSISWKRGALTSLISRVYMVCSNETLLEKELKSLKHVFHKRNGYPSWFIDQVIHPFKNTSTRVKVLNTTSILQNNPLKKCTLWSCHMLDLMVTLFSKQWTIA